MKRSVEASDCEFTGIPVCPHCGAEYDVWKDDRPLVVNYDDGGKSDYKCDDCRKPFVAVTIVKYAFYTAVDEEHADDEMWGPREPSEVEG